MRRARTLLLASSVLATCLRVAIGQVCGPGLPACGGIGLVCSPEGFCIIDVGQECGVSVNCQDGFACIAGNCVPSSGGEGDPILRGFDGRHWEFKGKPGGAYVLYSDAHHSISMGVIAAEMQDHNGTYINSLGFAYLDHRFAVELDADSSVSLSLEGNDIKISSTPQGGRRKFGSHGRGVAVEWRSHLPGFGRTVTIATGTLDVRVWMVPAGLLDAGGKPQPAYLCFRMALLSAPVGGDAQGLVGETLALSAALLPPPSAELDHQYHYGQGKEEDYAVGGLHDTDFRFSRFGTRRSVHDRRLLVTAVSAAETRWPLVACSGDGGC